MFRNKLEISLYRYNPEEDKFPYMKKYIIEKPERDKSLLRDGEHLVRNSRRGSQAGDLSLKLNHRLLELLARVTF